MIRFFAISLIVLLLAACDPATRVAQPVGVPESSSAPSSTGVRVSGDARIGVSISRNNIDHWAISR